ncbi:hypothetical protein N9L68_00965 [bacterium]|nr:hypothetical protein [bacterium]
MASSDSDVAARSDASSPQRAENVESGEGGGVRAEALQIALDAFEGRLNSIQEYHHAEIAELKSTLEESQLETETMKVTLEDWRKKLDSLENRMQLATLNYSEMEIEVAARFVRNEELMKEAAELKLSIEENMGGLHEMMTELQGISMDKSEATGPKKVRGYIPQKNKVPEKFEDKIEKWKSWKEDVTEFFDDQNQGMKIFLEAVGKEVKPISGAWKNPFSAQLGESVTSDSVNVYRALKQLTMGEARNLVLAVKEEDGFLAWQRLHRRFEPELEARQGIVLAQLAELVKKAGKSPSETRKLVTILEGRITVAEELTGKAIDDSHAKSILIAMLDPVTRQHTALKQGADTSYEELKRIILDFANRSSVDSPPTQLNPLGGEAEEDKSWDQMWEPSWYSDEGGDLGALGGKGIQPCHNCGGVGHWARECPYPAKGKGKGGFESSKGKGKDGSKGQKGFKGKGKGKGPLFGGCYNCGGPHFKQDCPALKGKGKGATVYSLDTWSSEVSEIRTLAALREVDEAIADLPPGLTESESEQETWKEVCDKKKRLRKSKTKVRFCAIPVKAAEAPKALGCDLLGEHCACDKRISKNSFAILEEREEAGSPLLPVHPQCEKALPPLDADLPKIDRCRSRRWFRKTAIKAPESLGALETIEPEGLRSVVEGEWELLEFAVDSGASETVIHEEMVKSVAVREGPASKRGVKYEVANGVRIPNLGEKKFSGSSEEGIQRTLTAQVCDVNKALLRVRKVVAAGNRVVFDDEASYIEDKRTGEKMWMQEVSGMYMLKLWIPKSSTPFHRQA